MLSVSIDSRLYAVPAAVRLRHPAGLPYIFATEMWERFCYFGLRSILVFYLVRHHHMADAAAVSIFAGFAALSSFAIIFGGFIADRLIGAERTVVSGGILMIAGSSVLAREATLIPAVSGAVSTPFVLALSLIAIGTGLLKCGATTMVGRLYSLDDPRRDVGFTIYYLGVNLGSGIAAIVCGYVGEQIGWGAGFGVAALGMLIGIATFLAGRRHYGPARDRDPKPNMKESSAG